MVSRIPHIHAKNRVPGVAGPVFGLDLLLDTQALQRALGAVVGGIITIVGIWFNSRQQQRSRLAEKLADAYDEYLSATEQMLKTSKRASKTQ